tara:strand:- start:426 stop:572 length:147 start_codon:yes stop_codon:yes gene_type:complete
VYVENEKILIEAVAMVLKEFDFRKPRACNANLAAYSLVGESTTDTSAQ